MPSQEPDPSELTARSEAARQLDELLAKMSDVQREVFILCEIEQLSSVEVAEVLGVNENTVRTRLRRGETVVRSRRREVQGSDAEGGR